MRAFHLLFLLLLTPALLSGDAPYDNWDESSRQMAGEFFADIKIRDDLLAVDEYMLRVLVHPVETSWPQTQVSNIALEADLRTMIKLRGVSVPIIDRPGIRPMIETHRETVRFDEAMRFVWNLLEASDYLILSNPEVVSEMVVCDIYFELAGTRLSLAEVIVIAGHARYEPHDWGLRIVTPNSVR